MSIIIIRRLEGLSSVENKLTHYFLIEEKRNFYFYYAFIYKKMKTNMAADDRSISIRFRSDYSSFPLSTDTIDVVNKNQKVSKF